MGEQARSVELIVRCECGFEARGEESELVPVVQKHGRDVHNMEATREQVLAMARPAWHAEGRRGSGRALVLSAECLVKRICAATARLAEDIGLTGCACPIT